MRIDADAAEIPYGRSQSGPARAGVFGDADPADSVTCGTRGICDIYREVHLTCWVDCNICVGF